MRFPSCRRSALALFSRPEPAGSTARRVASAAADVVRACRPAPGGGRAPDAPGDCRLAAAQPTGAGDAPAVGPATLHDAGAAQRAVPELRHDDELLPPD